MNCREKSCEGCDQFSEEFDEEKGTGCEDYQTNILVYNTYMTFILRSRYDTEEEYKLAILKKADELIARDGKPGKMGVMVLEAPDMVTELRQFKEDGRSLRY